ncbi:LamG-like jellyroll fold domain-containing protein [Chitinophaga rhizosphaerae]|uniref:LamG-like jellyroll fold domain-containing protein n=1 Tax=Chitinophaga rhizosphaerae TaxID=1864947 RepID=UPI00196B2989|nr:LamG-like jellyroll fold domain-containing protein [Chitinophaga rhizosphaerae]
MNDSKGNMMKYLSLAASTMLVCMTAAAQQAPAFQYNMGRAGAVTYATAPDSLWPMGGTGNALKRKGQPLFFADAPADKKLAGEGAVLFREGAGYAATGAAGMAKGDFVLEIWLQANARQGAADRLPAKTSVLALGSKKSGYAVYRENNQWTLYANGVAARGPIGDVAPGEWAHIAIIVTKQKATVFLNGKKSAAETAALPLQADTLFLGSVARMEAFSGLIYDVRMTPLVSGKFNPAKDLHFNQQAVARNRQQAETRQRAIISAISANRQIGRANAAGETAAPKDWLVHRILQASALTFAPAADGLSGRLQLSNGLISREFYIGDNLAGVSFKNLSSGAQYLRAVKPEARIKFDSTWYDIGGLSGQPEKSYLLDAWLKDMVTDPSAFQFAGLEVRQPQPRYPWQQKYNAQHADWPPKGLHVVMHYEAPASKPEWKGAMKVSVHYEMYDGIPVVSKWITVRNGTGRPVLVNETECEVLAVTQDQEKRLHVESDYSFALANADPEGSALMHYAGIPPAYQAGGSTTKWLVDKDYNTWASHNQAEDKFLGFPHHSLLVSRLPMGPAEILAPGKDFTSFTTFELLHDSDDRERQSLAHRRFYRTLAPQVTESLITGGITSHDRKELKNFITQMGELGFERLDIMAWPGISHDKLDTGYVALWKEIAAFAKDRNIVMGGYELQVASRGRGKDVDCIDPKTGKPGSLFGQSVCIASKWKDTYYPAMWQFFDKTGLMTYNMDGPYHGDVCAATDHPHHNGLHDSQWKQWQSQVEVLHELQRRNMYVPIPDWYFLNGQSATGMGYREASANLTPQQQLLLGRQYIYDGTWHKTPTMGWMSLQLVGFYTNDPRVGLEPLADNLARYETGLFQHLASGCQFTLRGKRLYDTPETKAMVAKWVDWFRKYREILTSDIIHLGRPDGRDIDLMLHANPFLEDKGMLIAFNPTDHDIVKTVSVPLYYTGVKSKAGITGSDGRQWNVALRDGAVADIKLSIPAGGFGWYLIRESK